LGALKLVKRDRKKGVTQADYKVATKPVLASLDMHLKVWDARRENPDATLERLADIAGVFAQDGGFYVQCKYGARTILLSKDGNAVFVKQLADVPTALQAIYAATAAGELDAAIACAVKRELDA